MVFHREQPLDEGDDFGVAADQNTLFPILNGAENAGGGLRRG